MNDNTPSPEERSRIVADALSHSGLNDDIPSKLTLRQEIMSRAWDVTQLVQQRTRPVIKAVKDKGSYNFDSAQDFIYKMYREEYGKWSKEELCECISMLFAGMAMKDVEEYIKTQ